MTIKKRCNFYLNALALGTTLSLAAIATVHASTLVHPVDTAVAKATALRQGDVFTGVLPHTQPMHVAVALKLRNGDRLDSLIAAHQTLTSAQIAADYTPTLQQAQAVATYLTQMGFKNVVIAPNRLLVSADGTAGNAQAAFLTSFARVQTHDGRAAFANNSDAHVPATLQASVLSVVGLQSVYQAHTSAQRAQINAASNTPGFITHNPTEFASIYSATGLPTAAGVTVGIVTVGDLTQTLVDLHTFTTNNGLAPVLTQTVVTNGGSGDTSGTDEWDIDSQDVVGAGGGQVGQIIFYTTPSFSYGDLVAAFNTAVTANAAKIINVSIGGCETGAAGGGAAAAGDQIFKLGVAQGQTFSISTGDFGADGCRNGTLTPQWPASSPYVVAVGGTSLNASTTTWYGHTVWNTPGRAYFATGGSPSTFEPKPAWENPLVPGTTRGGADIAFDADPYTGSLVIVNGGIQLWGGTSLAAPIFAGLWARVIAVKGTSIGFAAPWLYQLPASDFHDVTIGNNNGETAAPGYDFPTGRGSLILSSAIQHLGVVNPLVANFSATASGLLVKFTDSSTDSGGSITAHAWTFGDAGTSKLASPSHVYLRAGTYNVAETVTDTAGFSSTKTVSVQVTR